MFGWLRDTLANTSLSLSYRHSMIPSRLLHHHQHQQQQQKQQQQQQQQQQQRQFSQKKKRPSSSTIDDEEESEEESNYNSFYHNPYHSSGQMNYADVPQQQYISNHTYPTYLARQQTSSQSTSSIDEQIHAKLFSLQHRGNQRENYAYRNEILPSIRPTFIPDTDKDTSDTIEDEYSEDIPVFYPGHYPNQDENFDFASVVLWYRNVMQSVKKFM
ncbi:hypothetical protein I4U23_026926 [Adineta vaga]|nr:hypothetical protein I4U23_026926 [Adineta vaga]